MKHYDLTDLDQIDPSVSSKTVTSNMSKTEWVAVFTVSILAFLYAGMVILLHDKPAWMQWSVGATFGTWLSFALFCMLHEAAHGNIFRNRPNAAFLNDQIGHALGIATLICYDQFKTTHRHHHKFTNDEVKDPNYWAVAETGWKIVPDIALAFAKNRTELSKFSARTGDTSVLKAYARHWAVSAPLLILGMIFIGPVTVMALWVLPAIISVAAIFLFFAHLPHGKSIGKDHVDERMPVYANGFNAIIDFISMGQKYHLLHHRYPRIPFHQLRNVSQSLMTPRAVSDETGYPAAPAQPQASLKQ